MTRGTFHCWITTLHLKTTSTTWFVVSSVLLPRHSKTITPKYTTCIQLSLQNPLHFNQHPKILHNKYILIMRMFAMWTSNPPPNGFWWQHNFHFKYLYLFNKKKGWVGGHRRTLGFNFFNLEIHVFSSYGHYTYAK